MCVTDRGAVAVEPSRAVDREITVDTADSGFRVTINLPVIAKRY